MDTSISIRHGERSDIQSIKKFLSKSPYIHRHLDWREPLDWIDSNHFYQTLDLKNNINALLCCAPENDKYFWVRIFACDQKDNIYKLWNPLINRFLDSIEVNIPEKKLLSLAYYPWMINLLEIEGWKTIDHIVQFEWENERNINLHSLSGGDSKIRRMKKRDVRNAFRIDCVSFENVWQQSFETFSHSFKQSGYATIYEEDDQAVGFQISTIKNNRAHLARIAVHPGHRGNHIGEFLLKDFINHCEKRKIVQISVNTQQTNTNSIALYLKWGFKEKGTTFPLFSLE